MNILPLGLVLKIRENEVAMSWKPECIDLLRNNDIPLESTIREVKESLKAPLILLQEIEIEIQRLCELVETMKVKREAIQKRIDDHNIILSPVRRVPQDVLHEIFFHCLPTHRNPIMTSSESPVLLTRICRSWRAIALSSPRIWSKIHVPFPGDPGFSTGYGIITDETSLINRHQRYTGLLQLRCDVVREWLSRSGTCPLSISMYHPGSNSDLQNPSLDNLSHELFNMLLSFGNRWTNVDLSMPEEIYHKLQGDMKPTTFSSLKSLKLNLHRTFHENYAHSPPIQLLAAPGLCSITISAIETTLHITRKLVQPIWNQLTHITFASSIADRCLLLLLRRCSNLVFGNFVISPHWPDDPIVDQEDVLLPCLESLALNDSGSYETMVIIFNAIKAPSLTKLSYQWADSRSPGDNSTIPLPAPVLPLLSNSTLITDLSLDGELPSQDIQEFLRHGERVTHLVFGKPLRRNPSGHIFYPPIFDHDVVHPDLFDLKLLSISSSAVLPLPRLESLEAYNLASLTDEGLLDFITSRINASKRGEIAALKSVKIYFHRRRQKDITEEVSRRAKEAGFEFKLELTYAPEGSRFFDRFSPSFGMTSNDCIWSSNL